MTDTISWVSEAVGKNRLDRSFADAARRRIGEAFNITELAKENDEELRFVFNSLQLEVLDYLENDEEKENLRCSASNAFRIARTIPWPDEVVEELEWAVRIGCLAVLGDRTADFQRILSQKMSLKFPIECESWGDRVWTSVLEVWIRLIRKNGWEDLNGVRERNEQIRSIQNKYEPKYLEVLENEKDPGRVWKLVAEYHLAKAAELLGEYLSEGTAGGKYDIREQLEVQFENASNASSVGHIIELEVFVKIMARTAKAMIENSIWTVTRAVNSKVSKFVESLNDKNQQNPIFEVLPPQRRTLLDHKLLGSNDRAVVVSLPTSSGKTFIAQFRILQALNQFEQERGWVAYLAPTRALVNQLTLRLRRDFSKIGVSVEKVSPALEIDGLEAQILKESNKSNQFRILVTTPEKFDLMLRGEWEDKIGRPLTLVVVDEAHGLANGQRGIKLELLLATIKRECRYAQFLLLTPFIENGEEIAKWLSPDSYKGIDQKFDWTPNDRVITIARAVKGVSRGQFEILLKTCHTSQQTLDIPETVQVNVTEQLGFSPTTVNSSNGNIAAVTAQMLHERGTVIVMTDTLPNSWKLANKLAVEKNREGSQYTELDDIQRFLNVEMGADFPLNRLLEYGIGVHHAGMSEDTRTLVEWLTENQHLKFLVATTTIAQGVNFPVSGVVFASHYYRGKNFTQAMPPEDFWNIAGRAGRIDQGDLGIIAMAANSDERQSKLEQYISTAVGELNSTLIEMVKTAEEKNRLLNLDSLSYQPEWSTFVQYLSHTYRQTGDHDQFTAEVEQVLRGTLGFRELQKSHKGWADKLIQGVRSYAVRIQDKPLKLVDTTGFSWESVGNTLSKLREEQISEDVWGPELFNQRRNDLSKMMGILLQIPELRKPLKEVVGGYSQDGDKLSRIVCDWVQGRPLTEMANEYFLKTSNSSNGSDYVGAMTDCCKSIFGRLTQNASWGLSALQSLTVESELDQLPIDQQRTLRNIPANVYYGVDSDEALTLRLLGVPRSAAPELSKKLEINSSDSIHVSRSKLHKSNTNDWESALGNLGKSYHRVWSIIEGNS